MLGKLRSLLASPKPAPSISPGQRVYAVGDIHGRADLLCELLCLIKADSAKRGEANVALIFLGDLVDRGPDSRLVVEKVMELARNDERVRLLKGNHEEVFLQALDGDTSVMRLFMRIGGKETLVSYGLTTGELASGSYSDLAERARARVPDSHREFLASAPDSLTVGDYLFAHAGVRPEVAFGEQASSDLRWIRHEFLEFEGHLEKVVVHGHSITHEVQQHPHRIGIDTGAYETGILTALGLEGNRRWLVQTTA